MAIAKVTGLSPNRKGSDMGKIIFILEDIRISPNAEPKLNVEMKLEPLKQNGRAKELADRIMDTIQEYTDDQGGFTKVKTAKRY